MAKRNPLWLVVVLAASLIAAPCSLAGPAQAASCTGADVQKGTCTDAQNQENGTVLTGEDGNGGATDPPATTEPESQTDLVGELIIGISEAPYIPDTPEEIAERERKEREKRDSDYRDCMLADYTNCQRAPEAAPPAATPPPEAPGVRIRDLAIFEPRPTEAVMQPNVWMLRDAHTNFVVTAEQHSVTATLLGRPAEVRYTPVAYTFDYGDGSDPVTTEWGGARWEDQGLREFDETATSHIYRERGTYAPVVSVVYTAEYRLGTGPWVAVTGTLTVPKRLEGRTVTIDTVLTAGPCAEHPTVPGCDGWEDELGREEGGG